MTLPNVNVGDPHTAAHNAERALLNLLSSQTPDALRNTERQRIRQDVDGRQKGPLNTDVAMTLTTVADPTLTKFYGLSVAGQGNGVNRLLSAAEIAAYPVDTGQSSSYKSVYAASGFGYFWNFGVNDNVTSPPVNGSNRLMPSEYRLKTNAKKMQILLYRIDGAALDGHFVCVDGRPLTMRPQPGSSVVDYLTLVFADNSVHDVMFSTTAGLSSILVGPNEEIWKPEPREGVILYTSGDSYDDPVVWSDTGNGQGAFIEGYSYGVGWQLGAADHYCDAISGTGFIKSTTGTESISGTVNNNYEARLPQLLRAAAAAWANNQQDFVWMIPNGSVNDMANLGGVDHGVTITQQAVIDSFRRMAVALRGVHPKAKIVWGQGNTPALLSAHLTASIALLQALKAQCVDLGVYYIDTTGWLKGTGYLGAPVVATESITSGSAVMTGSGYQQSSVGSPVSGTGIPAGTYVVSVQSATSLTMSAAATVTNASASITFGSTRLDGDSSLYAGQDGVHLIGLGYRYLRFRLGNKLKRILTDAGILLNQVI